jgi:hypothetical protein
MKLNRMVLTASLLVPLALGAPGASADEKNEHDHEHRQHGAHVHGIATLNLALEGEEVHVELDSPAANIVGFEYAPSSDADHAALDQAAATLKDGDRLFRFNPEAGCRMEKASVASSLLDEEHGEPKGDHDREKHEEHGHNKDEHEQEGETHSDIEAAYHFECDQPAKLTRLTVELFEVFPRTEKLNVQYVIESKQGAAELRSAEHVVEF